MALIAGLYTAWKMGLFDITHLNVFEYILLMSWQEKAVATAVIGVLVLVFFQQPLLEIVNPPKPITVASSQGNNFCPSTLNFSQAKFTDEILFLVTYKNLGSTGVFNTIISSENVLSKYDETLSDFNNVSSKSWIVENGQPQSYKFKLKLPEDIPENIGIEIKLGCTFDVSIFNFKCQSFNKCCNYAKNSSGLSYALIGDTC